MYYSAECHTHTQSCESNHYSVRGRTRNLFAVLNLDKQDKHIYLYFFKDGGHRRLRI